MTAYVKGAGGKLGDCPFSHKVLLTLEAKGMPYKTSLIDLANKPSWLQEKSGGKVPVVQLGEDGEWVADSDVIVKRLEKLQPQPSMASAVPPQVSSSHFTAAAKHAAILPRQRAASCSASHIQLRSHIDTPV